MPKPAEIVRQAVDELIRKKVFPAEYRRELEQAVDTELRRQARLNVALLTKRVTLRGMIRQLTAA